MCNMGRVELLAPAGNYEGLIGAVNAGADAVYLGGDRFGARAYAENFNRESLIEGIHYAHFFDRRIYLTVNTLIKEKEFDGLSDYLTPFYEAGLDGVIVQDIGVLKWLREQFPELPVHASTQMNITHAYGAAFLRELGVSRVVPARELSLEELKQIRSRVDIELETFIHGAMCYSYSGQCLFSSILGGRSGNRGRCAQPCRLPYEGGDAFSGERESGHLSGKNNRKGSGKRADRSEGNGKDIYKAVSRNENRPPNHRKIHQCSKQPLNHGKMHQYSNGYPLSMKDMCTVEILPELIEAGIHSFKIEGRMKKPEYAAGVTAIYRKYIDRYYQAGKAEYQVSAEDKAYLQSLYIRSAIGEGYYHRHNGAEMITADSPAYAGADDGLLQEIRRKYIDARMTIGISGQASFKPGEPASLTLSGRGITVDAAGAVVQEAKMQPLTTETVSRQLKKSGNTVFVFDELKLTIAENVFMTVRDLNQLRRDAISRLEQALLKSYIRTTGAVSGYSKSNIVGNNLNFNGANQYTAQKSSLAKNLRISADSHIFHARITTGEQWQVAAGHSIRRIYVDIDTWDMTMNLPKKYPGQEWFAILPRIFRLREEKFLTRYQEILNSAACDGVLIQNIESYAWITDIGYHDPIVADTPLYIWNAKARDFWQERVAEYCLPLELNAHELTDLTKDTGLHKPENADKNSGTDEPEEFPARNRKVEDYALKSPAVSCQIYGRIPMMVSANCVTGTRGNCREKDRRRDTPAQQKEAFEARKEMTNRAVAPEVKSIKPTETDKTFKNIVCFTDLTDRMGKHFPVYQNCRHCYNIIYNSVPLSWHEGLKQGFLTENTDNISLRLDFTTETARETEAIIAGFLNRAAGRSAPLPFREHTTGHYRRGVE